VTPPDLPGFTFVQHLGTGGFADVLLYEQEWPRQRVAVKVVRPDIGLTPREKELFRSEANAMARLADHPFIVSVLTAGETGDGRPYLVMRYCPPPDLGARVRTTPMAVVDALSTGVKLASAVETAHRSGILHRDIKPSNVLVTTYSEPALTDFGIAGRMHEVDTEGEVRMSYPWAPPELIDGRSHGSVASDVYSLGATIWNLLVGRSPFVVPHGDNSDHALVTRILHTPSPPTGRPDVPPALDQLLQQCLAKEPSHRPATALEVARALQRIEASLGYARTAVAVESVREDTGGGHDTSPDATRVKPLGVVHAQTSSGTTADPLVQAPTVRPAAARERSRGALWWSLGGVAVAVALLLALLVRGGGSDDPGTADPARAPTPDAVVPEAPLAAPDVTGTKTGKRVVFRWTQPDRKAGDSWLWQIQQSGETGRTSRPRLTLPATGGQVCVDVTLVRGSTTSQRGSACVT